jgi:Uma2 family endonuclease
MTVQTRAARAVNTRRNGANGLPTPRRFTIDEYDRMGKTRILHEDERAELIRGEIVCMTPVGSPHMRCIGDLMQWLVTALSGRALVRIQGPIRIAPHSEPEPDVVVARLREDRYGNSHPDPVDILLVIEVADSSLAYDRGVKLPLYAEAGIPEYWIVDLRRRRVLAHRDPEGQSYRNVQIMGRDGTLSPQAFPDVSLPVAELLG